MGSAYLKGEGDEWGRDVLGDKIGKKKEESMEEENKHGNIRRW